MSIVYLGGCAVLLVMNFGLLDDAVKIIISNAFSLEAAGGGAAGYAFMLAARFGIDSHQVREHVLNVQQEHRLLEEQRQVVHNVQLDIIQKQELEVAQSVQLEQQLLQDHQVVKNV